MRPTLLAVLAAAALAASAPRAQAQARAHGTDTGAGEGACRADAEKLCKGVEGGKGRFADCLKAHVSQLSADCAAQHPDWTAVPLSGDGGSPAPSHGTQTGGETQQPGAGRAGDCGADAKRLCAPGDNLPGRRADCLRQHWDDLSEVCRKSHPEWARPSGNPAAPPPLGDWPSQAEQWKAACGPSLRAVCRRYDASEAAVWSCVEAHRSALTQACRDFSDAHEPWRTHCPAEREKLCPNATTAEATPCMLKHLSQLPPACRDIAKALKKRARKRR